MRLADLLGSDVIEASGDKIGDVGDVWLAQEGTPIGGFGAALRVDRLVIGRLGLASRAGYDRPDVRGPVIIAWLLRRRTQHRPVVSWSDIAAIEEGRYACDRGSATSSAPLARAARDRATLVCRARAP